MSATYHYTPSPPYINQLTFDYIETYSLQRGSAFEENYKLTYPEYQLLKNRKNKLNDLLPNEEEKYSELHELFGFTQYLANQDGLLHPSSQKINIFKSDSPQANLLINILKTEVIDIPQWMCAPVYRDAIIFYNNDGSILSVLNVCLSCSYMATRAFHDINADAITYEKMRLFFIAIGHSVEIENTF